MLCCAGTEERRERGEMSCHYILYCNIHHVNNFIGKRKKMSANEPYEKNNEWLKIKKSEFISC